MRPGEVKQLITEHSTPHPAEGSSSTESCRINDGTSGRAGQEPQPPALPSVLWPDLGALLDAASQHPTRWLPADLEFPLFTLLK